MAKAQAQVVAERIKVISLKEGHCFAVSSSRAAHAHTHAAHTHASSGQGSIGECARNPNYDNYMIPCSTLSLFLLGPSVHTSLLHTHIQIF